MKKEIKSRKDRFIFDSNIYELDIVGIKLGFTTSIKYDENIIEFTSEDNLGQSCTILIDTQKNKVKMNDILKDIESVESNFKPEKINSKEDIELFYSKLT